MAAKPQEINFDDIDVNEFMRHKRETLTAKRGELQTQLNGIDEQLANVDGFFNPTKPAPTVLTAPAPKAPGTKRGPRKKADGAPTSRQLILNLVVERRETGIDSNAIAEALPDIKGHGNVISKLKAEDYIQNVGKGKPWKPTEKALIEAGLMAPETEPDASDEAA